MSDRYEEIIKQLRESEPVLPNKEELTSTIISRIQQEESLATKKANVFTLIIRPAMTAAAIFLVGLFFFQQVDYSSEFREPDRVKAIAHKDILVFQHAIANEEELSKELKACLKEVKSNSKKIDRKCAFELVALYKKLKMQETKSYKQRVINWFNH